MGSRMNLSSRSSKTSKIIKNSQRRSQSLSIGVLYDTLVSCLLVEEEKKIINEVNMTYLLEDI